MKKGKSSTFKTNARTSTIFTNKGIYKTLYFIFTNNGYVRGVLVRAFVFKV